MSVDTGAIVPGIFYTRVGNLWTASGRPSLSGPLFEDNFILGTTQPTASNTGPRIAEINLSNYAGDFTNVQSGDVISGLAITGQVNPSGSPTATFRDCLIKGDTDPTPTASGYYDIGRQVGTTGGLVTYEFCEIRAENPSYRNNGWKGGNVRLVRCKGSSLTDFLSPHGSSGSNIWKTFQAHGCYADNFYTDTEPAANQSDLITHNDFCQAQGRLTLLEIIGCANGATGRPRTSWLLLQTNQGTYGTVRINSNWMYGATASGSSVNIPIAAGSFENFEFQGNRVSNTGQSPRVLMASTVRTTFASTISGNTFLETGAALTINNA